MTEDEEKTIAVLTTINKPNNKVGNWFEITKNKTIVVGDNKTPQDWNHDKCTYYSIADQKKSEFEIFEHSPSEKILFKNIYSYFSNSDIPFWPRGYPLNLVNLDESNINLTDITKTHNKEAGIGNAWFMATQILTQFID